MRVGSGQVASRAGPGWTQESPFAGGLCTNTRSAEQWGRLGAADKRIAQTAVGSHKWNADGTRA